MVMKGQQQLFSTGKDNWQTPQKLFQYYQDVFIFTVDGAADPTNTQLSRWWGPQSPLGVEDSLVNDWSGERVWLNPPYSAGAQFIEKAYLECFLHGVLSVVLMPARTDTKWFHSFVYEPHKKDPEIVHMDFLKGRVKFVDPTGHAPLNSAPFPSVVVVFDGRKVIL